MRNHTTTIIGVLAITLIVVAGFTLMPHRSARHSGGGIPVSQWKSSGSQDPKSAIISTAAAIRKRDGPAIVDFLTPEMRKMWEFNLQPAMRKNNKTLAQLISAHAESVPSDTAIQIVKQRVLSDRWALMIVKINVGGRQQTVSVVLRRIAGEWKVDDFQ